MMRLAFGGAPNPPTWCAFSEMVTDLSNEIGLSTEWDHRTLKNPEVPTPTAPHVLPDDVPFAKAAPTTVRVPTTTTSRADCFIDDIVNVFLDLGENRQREQLKVPLAVYAATRPHAGADEPIKRKPNISTSKFAAEATPAETQIVLGWKIDTRRLLVALPDDKFLAWMKDLRALLNDKAGVITKGELDSLVGRLNHAGYIIPLSRHFIHRIRKRAERAMSKKQHVTLTLVEMEDVQLWYDVFLPRANKGLSMNTMTQRHPDNIGWSDTCPYGGGGFLLNGTAWRFRIPQSSPLYGGDIVNNFLEFLGLVVNIKLMVLHSPQPNQCFLVLGDNTSGLGWLLKSGHLKPDSIYIDAVQFVARDLATTLIRSGNCLSRQHIAGKKNVIADYLSFFGEQRLNDRGGGSLHPFAVAETTDTELTTSFHRYLPQLIPQNFAIYPLPDEISSFVCRSLQIAESSLIRKLRTHSSETTASGGGGWAFAGPWASAITPASIACPRRRQNSSSEGSSPPFGPIDGLSQESFLAHCHKNWRERLSKLPQASWLRRFGTVSNGAPSTSRTAPTIDPKSEHY